jgi:putative aminopeptidase FrvX
MEFIKENIQKYVQIDGCTHSENVVLDELEKDLYEYDFVRNKKYGISVTIGEGKNIILIDSHVDKVQSSHITPLFEEDEVLTATGLDNRIGVVVNLLLLKTITKIKDNWKIIYLFTTKEEFGGIGIKQYIQSVRKAERKNWKRFYEIDVAFAKTVQGYYHPKSFTFRNRNEYALSLILDEALLPTLGKGICPIDQRFASYSRPKYNVNAKQVKYYVKDLEVKYIAVPVVDMHYKRSTCNLKDVVRMYEWLKNDIEKIV